MGEYEPDDSRKYTHSAHTAPGEPPRTGAHEDEARRAAQRGAPGNGMRDEAATNDTRGIEGQRVQDKTFAEAGEGQPLGAGADGSPDEAPDPAVLRRDADRPLDDK